MNENIDNVENNQDNQEKNNTPVNNEKVENNQNNSAENIKTGPNTDKNQGGEEQKSKIAPRRIYARSTFNRSKPNGPRGTDGAARRLTVPNYKSQERQHWRSNNSPTDANSAQGGYKKPEAASFKDLQKKVFKDKLEFKMEMEELVAAGVQLGHKKMYTNPLMKKYIFCNQGDTAILDLDKTIILLQEACEFLEAEAAKGKKILFVGTKDRIKDLVQKFASECGAMYINHRWAPGTLTNFYTLNASIKNMENWEKRLQNPKIKMVKKERLKLERRCKKMNLYLSGLKNMKTLPDILVVIDAPNAVQEAKKMKIPVVGIIDSNGDPRINHPIPANDDSFQAVGLVLGKMTEFISSGVKFFAANYKPEVDSGNRFHKVFNASNREGRDGGNRFHNKGFNASRDRGSDFGNKFHQSLNNQNKEKASDSTSDTTKKPDITS